MNGAKGGGGSVTSFFSQGRQARCLKNSEQFLEKGL